MINLIAKLNKILKKEKKRLLDLKENIEAVLSLPINWIDLNFLVIERAAEYCYDTNGVDYIHIATMEINSIGEILSADEDLDKVRIIKRIDPLDY